VKSIDDTLFEDVFAENIVNLEDLKECSIDLEDITGSDFLNNEDMQKTTTENIENTENIGNIGNRVNTLNTLKSGSTCSSRSSYTNDDGGELEEQDIENHDVCDDNIIENDNRSQTSQPNGESDCWEDEENGSNVETEEEVVVEVTIPKFPVQVICMENCENTFDDLILNSDLKKEEWFSAFMQVIMILITYQKAFGFTHNDLHTNNVMYNHTDKKFLFYCYNGKYYKVPTYGRIYKIIDFGRSIYKFDGKVFCSDSFQHGGDAATQYNIEPFFNEKKPRLEPNFSFDLCRLACSIFDYVVDDFEEAIDLSKCNDPVKRLIIEWCLDDKGCNILYKNNGDDRYPDFKLYKMIARCVHNHTPQSQLLRPEFADFAKFKGDVPKNDVIDIDAIPSYI
jgi:hypothetical protein